MMGDVRAEATKVELEMKNVVDAKSPTEVKAAMDNLQKDIDLLRKDPKFATEVLKQIASDTKDSNDLPKIAVNYENGVAQFFFFAGNPKDANANQHIAVSEALTEKGKDVLKDAGPLPIIDFMKTLHPQKDTATPAQNI
jgi:hypothetical protein